MVRIGLIGIGVVAGIPAGGVAGFYLTYFTCVALDPFYRGLGSVGWVFCFFTIPAGAPIRGSPQGGLGTSRLARWIGCGGAPARGKNTIKGTPIWS